MSKIVDLVYESVETALAEKGYELIEITYVKEYDEMHLVIVINKIGGITFDDLEYVNGLVEPILDQIDPTNGQPYNLDVSSMGIDRPIVTNKDFERSLNTEVVCSLYKAINKKKSIEGTLVAYNDQEITLLVNGKQTIIQKNLISVIKPKIQF